MTMFCRDPLYNLDISNLSDKCIDKHFLLVCGNTSLTLLMVSFEEEIFLILMKSGPSYFFFDG